MNAAMLFRPPCFAATILGALLAVLPPPLRGSPLSEGGGSRGALRATPLPEGGNGQGETASEPLRRCVKNSDWSLPQGARIEGDTLIAEIPAEEGPRNIWCAAKIDVADALAAMKCVSAHVRFRAENVSEPKEAWQGVKVQFMFDSPSGAGRIYRSVNTARGTYGWTNVTARISPLRDAATKDGVATLILGLEACTGRAEFDLSALKIILVG